MEMSVFGDHVNLSLGDLDLTSLGQSPLTKNSVATHSPCLPDSYAKWSTRQTCQPVPDSLQPLTSHPLFGELQSLLREECQPTVLPFSLLSASQAAKAGTDHTVPISVSIGMLQMRFLTAESKLCGGDQTHLKDLQQAYRVQAAKMESDRFSGLQSARPTPWFYPSINMYYDHCHHQLIERVRRSLHLLEKRCPRPLDVTTGPANTPRLAHTAHIAHQHSAKSPQRPQMFAPPGSPGAPAFTSTPKRTPPIKKQGPSAVALGVMNAWYMKNPEHPYPSYGTAEVMAKAGGISVEQVKKWFANRRTRDGRTKTLTEIAKRRKRCREEDSIEFTACKQARHC